MFKDRLGVDIDIREIDRCHRLGPNTNQNKTRSIVVKFTGYAPRMKVFLCRKKLKNSGIYINDHLTAVRSKVMYVARQLKKNRLINNAWSHDGRIIIKDNDEKLMTANSISDLIPFDTNGVVNLSSSIFS